MKNAAAYAWKSTLKFLQQLINKVNIYCLKIKVAFRLDYLYPIQLIESGFCLKILETAEDGKE